MTDPVYHVPWQNRLARAILRPSFRTLFHLLARVKIVGRENVPATGAYLIAINHVSIFDPPFIIAFWPVCPEALGAIEIWSKPGQAPLARFYGGIPVHRNQYDRQVINQMLAVLNSGRPLVIAPEGERSHVPGLLPGQPGIAYAVDRANVPVVPVGIVGTTEDFFQQAKGRIARPDRPLLEIRIGKPQMLPPINGSGAERRAARQYNVDRVMCMIAELLPEDYRGVYRDGYKTIHDI